VAPALLSLAWIVVNPVLFKKPVSTRSWESRCVFGERVWDNRDQVPAPQHHRALPKMLIGVSSPGMLLAIWGFIALTVWPAEMGVALAYIGKSWYWTGWCGSTRT